MQMNLDSKQTCETARGKRQAFVMKTGGSGVAKGGEEERQGRDGVGWGGVGVIGDDSRLEGADNG